MGDDEKVLILYACLDARDRRESSDEERKESCGKHLAGPARDALMVK